jgi:hypothetical protein
MWVGNDMINLRQVLAALPHNAWEWRMLDFYGMGRPPGRGTMEEFEDQAATPGGYLFSWAGLLSFAAHLQQAFDCVLVAVDPGCPVDPDSLARDEFAACRVVVEAVDSGEWILSVNHRVPERDDVTARWKKLALPA